MANPTSQPTTSPTKKDSWAVRMSDSVLQRSPEFYEKWEYDHGVIYRPWSGLASCSSLCIVPQEMNATKRQPTNYAVSWKNTHAQARAHSGISKFIRIKFGSTACTWVPRSTLNLSVNSEIRQSLTM